MLSVLRCEANNTPTDAAILASSGPADHLWQVWIDEVLIGERVLPFGPSDNWIELEADTHDPILSGNGKRFMSARRVGNVVLWFNPLPDELGTYSPGLDENEVIAFSVDQYVQEVTHRAELTEAIGQDRGPIPLGGNNLLAALLERAYPTVDALYTTPRLADDPVGSKLLKHVRRCLFDASTGLLEIIEGPAEWTDIAMGLDAEGFPEANWRIGQGPRGLAVQFMQYPSFPLWLGGEPIEQAFRAIWNDLTQGKK